MVRAGLRVEVVGFFYEDLIIEALFIYLLMTSKGGGYLCHRVQLKSEESLWELVSSSITWFLGLNSRSRGLAAGAFTWLAMT